MLDVQSAAQTLGAGQQVLMLATVACEARIGVRDEVTGTRSGGQDSCTREEKNTFHTLPSF